MSKTRVFLVVAGVLVAIYAATAAWSLPYHLDAMTNAVTAWSMADTGSPIVESHSKAVGEDYFGNINWFVSSPRGPVAQYPPGAALLTAPFYLFATDAGTVEMTGNNRRDVDPIALPIPDLWPATLVAVLSTATAFGLLAISFTALGSSRSAIAGGLIGGLGTSAWSVAADMSWQHGPTMMWIAAGLALLSTDRWRGSGLAFAGAILTRPHTAVVPAAVGLGRFLRDRRIRPLVSMAFSSGIGLMALLAYNYWLFGSLTISGGYGSVFSERLTGGDPVEFAANLWGGFFDLQRGFLIWSPFLLVLVIGLPAAWRAAPVWVRSAAVGGIVYLLLQYGANRFSGGDGHFTYRYPLEALVSGAPLFFLSAEHLTRLPLGRKALGLTVALSVTIHGLGAIIT